MCGLSGYILRSGDERNDDITRVALLCGLSGGIDKRGGHAAGWAAFADDGTINMQKNDGPWEKQDSDFLAYASKHNVCLMHARWATMGAKIAANAHPFAIERDGKVVLVGAHNGCISGTWISAKDHKREPSVDSLELYHLLADGELDAIQDLEGYGVLTWLEPEHPGVVFVVKLSKRADFHAITLPGRLGVVWGSTEDIVKKGLMFADLDDGKVLDLPEVGRVYRLTVDGVAATGLTGVEVGKNKKKRYGNAYSADASDSDRWGGYGNGSFDWTRYSGSHSSSHAQSEWSKGFDMGRSSGIAEGRRLAEAEMRQAGKAVSIQKLVVTPSGQTWAKVLDKWEHLADSVWQGMRPMSKGEWEARQTIPAERDVFTPPPGEVVTMTGYGRESFTAEPEEQAPDTLPSSAQPKVRVAAWTCEHNRGLMQPCDDCDAEAGLISPESEDEWIDLQVARNFQT